MEEKEAHIGRIAFILTSIFFLNQALLKQLRPLIDSFRAETAPISRKNDFKNF